VFYSLLKIYARLAIKVYCRRIIINQPEVLKSEGPLLLAANHPNSFLDGIILTTLFDHPVHSLARGDAFTNKWMNQFLRSIQLLPVYRTSEGVENLEHNYTTFEACQQTFEEGGIVLIFSEGRCENEWHLRSLRKGTARLATTAWKKGIPLKVVPVALNYSSFRKFGKEVHLYFGDPITPHSFDLDTARGKQLVDFTALLHTQLRHRVYEIHKKDKAKLRDLFSIKKDRSFYPLLLPAIAGFLAHAPLFYLCKLITGLRFKNSGHYDSVLTSLLLITYPVYVAAACVMGYLIQPFLAPVVFIFLPFTAWACVQVKYQLGL
jgi:1-acyl-sn-glycerol-3-phosphate acyltransferase